jgi:hypothetical protein
MSVSLLMKTASNPDDQYIPIATNDAFKEFWAPGCLALGLEWIPQFHSGLELRKEDIPQILEELSRLREWMRTRFTTPRVEFLDGRIERLSQKLREFAADPEASGSIG